MAEIEVTQSNTGTYTVNFECPDGEELSKANARLLFEESAISEVIDDLNMHRGDHALLARIAELEAERDRLLEAMCRIECKINSAKTACPPFIQREFGEAQKWAHEALEGGK